MRERIDYSNYLFVSPISKGVSGFCIYNNRISLFRETHPLDVSLGLREEKRQAHLDNPYP